MTQPYPPLTAAAVDALVAAIADAPPLVRLGFVEFAEQVRDRQRRVDRALVPYYAAVGQLAQAVTAEPPSAEDKPSRPGPTS